MIPRLAFLLLLVIGTLLLNICLGTVSISPAEAVEAVLSPNTVASNVVDIIWQIRLPRMLCAFVVGSALAVSGYLLQALSRNYLADPYLTGVSSGAALAVAVGVIAGAPFSLMPLAALAGGLCISLLVALMARTSGGLSVTRLLLAGVAVSAVCGSLITLSLTNLAAAGKTQGLYYWLAGSVSGRTWIELRATGFYIVAAIVGAFALSKPLRVLSVGGQSAASLGLNVVKTQWAILVTAVVLCGAAVSLSGIVGFVGLVAPYLARATFGTDERLHLLTSVFIGGVLVALSDLAARTIVPGAELPLGTLLSLIGAPFFLWLVVRHRDEVR